MRALAENSWEVEKKPEGAWGIKPIPSIPDVSEQEQTRQREFPSPRCPLYNPLSSTEGRCYDDSIVNYGGCQNPDACDRHKKLLEEQRK